jgi:hypothetical protein
METTLLAVASSWRLPFLNSLAVVNWSDPFIVALIGVAGAIVAALIGVLPHFLKRPPPAMGQPAAVAEGEWAERIEVDSGIFYKARLTRANAQFAAESPDASDAAVLVIFVHGILGGAKSTWGSLGDLLRLATPTEFDLLAYGYPAGLLHQASIESGARDLMAALRNGRFSKYPHLLFITHSTGGLLLKHVFKRDYAQVMKDMADVEQRIDAMPSIAFRTRQIINIAVPHSGGSLPASAILIPLYHLIFIPLLLPAMAFDATMRALRLWKKMPRGYSYGYNRIVWQLRWRNSGLTELERAYRMAVRNFDQKRLPRPVSIEINGTDDGTIDKGPDDVHDFSASSLRATSKEDTTSVLFRGTHPTVKRADSIHDTLVIFLAGFLRRYQNTLDMLLARNAVGLTLVFDRDASLIGAEDMAAPESAEWSDTAESSPL